jgi:hypothetical protein
MQPDIKLVVLEQHAALVDKLLEDSGFTGLSRDEMTNDGYTNLVIYAYPHAGDSVFGVEDQLKDQNIPFDVTWPPSGEGNDEGGSLYFRIGEDGQQYTTTISDRLEDMVSLDDLIKAHQAGTVGELIANTMEEQYYLCWQEQKNILFL